MGDFMIAVAKLFPANAKTLSIAVTTSASTAVDLPNTGNSIRIVNDGAVTAFVSFFGAATVPVATEGGAVNTCTPILAGEDTTFSLPGNGQIYRVSAITATSTATLYVSVGDGE